MTREQLIVNLQNSGYTIVRGHYQKQIITPACFEHPERITKYRVKIQKRTYRAEEWDFKLKRWFPIRTAFFSKEKGGGK